MGEDIGIRVGQAERTNTEEIYIYIYIFLYIYIKHLRNN